MNKIVLEAVLRYLAYQRGWLVKAMKAGVIHGKRRVVWLFRL